MTCQPDFLQRCLYRVEKPKPTDWIVPVTAQAIFLIKGTAIPSWGVLQELGLGLGVLYCFQETQSVRWLVCTKAEILESVADYGKLALRQVNFSPLFKQLLSPDAISLLDSDERKEIIKDKFQYDKTNDWYEYKHPTSQRTTLIINPAADYNQAFNYIAAPQVVGMEDSNVIVAKIANLAELNSILTRLDRKIDFIGLGGHGNAELQRFGEGDEGVLSVRI